MYILLLVLFLLVALLLCVVVLLQQSKGNGLAGAFGGAGAGEALFGARGVTTILHKATIYLGAAFMLLSLGLALVGRSSGGGNSLSQRAADQLPAMPTAQPLSDPTATPIDDSNADVAPAETPENSEPVEGGGDQ